MKRTQALKTIDLGGKYEVHLADGSRYSAVLPGTLDENSIGYTDFKAEKWNPDADVGGAVLDGMIVSRLTRKHTYTGKATFTRSLSICEDDLYDLMEGRKRAFVYIERSRRTDLYLNDDAAPVFIEGTLSTPYVWEVTECLKRENILSFMVDNSFEDWPAEAIKYSVQGGDESGTNWNGILGEMKFMLTPSCIITNVMVYPGKDWIDVKVETDSSAGKFETIAIDSFVLNERYEEAKRIEDGRGTCVFSHIPVRQDAAKWDEGEGNLYSLVVSGKEMLPFETSFGLRTFSDGKVPYFTLNDRHIFLRGETNCAVFPEKGYEPCDVRDWDSLMASYASYGVNFVMFRSHCPPEAAFEAADKMGIMVMAELSCWNPYSCLELKEEYDYYFREAQSILKTFSNHPSFVMLSLGNESGCDENGLDNMHYIMDKCRQTDPTRLYTLATDAFYGERGTDARSDFYMASSYKGKLLRGCSRNLKGFINEKYPESRTDYEGILGEIKTEFGKPVCSFGVGQYRVLPDLEEAVEFHGISEPDCLKYAGNKADEKGLLEGWKEYAEASMSLAALCYREEIEAALRTGSLGGICLSGLQDYPGKGLETHGFLTCHGRVKPFASACPALFKRQFGAVVPLLKMEKYVYTEQESLQFVALLANYGKEDICSRFTVSIKKDGCTITARTFDRMIAPQGEVTELKEGYFELWNLPEEGMYSVCMDVGSCSNSYDFWVYTVDEKKYEKGEIYDGVYITDSESIASQLVSNGKKVFLSPKADLSVFNGGILSSFSTDFASSMEFKEQSGYMGYLSDDSHPVMKNFHSPKEASWLWWALTKDAVAMKLPEKCRCIVRAFSSPLDMKRLCFMYQKDSMIVSSLGLLEKQQYPEVRALISSVIKYLASV